MAVPEGICLWGHRKAMGKVRVPVLPVGEFVDGTPIQDGDQVVPVLVIRNKEGEHRQIKGETITVKDVNPPIVTNHVVQTAENGGLVASANAVDNKGVVAMYHLVIDREITDTQALAQLIPQAAPEPQLTATNHFVTETQTFQPITNGGVGLVSHILAVDEAGNIGSSRIRIT